MQFSNILLIAGTLLSALAGVSAEKFIVRFKENNSRISLSDIHYTNLSAKIQELNGNSRLAPSNTVNYKFDTVFNGYSGDFNAELVNWIKSQPEVEYVNKQVRHSANALQSDAPWGLTRISSAKKYTDAVKGEYRYVSETGQGVDVYVLDTGINFKHIDFEGRARWGKTFAENSTDDDVHGHGTHVAGTIAGRKYGVSKGANVIAVKVLGDDGYGSTEEVVAGIEWVVKNPPRWGTPIKGKVINMSLGGDLDLALNEAVNKAVDAGVHIVVAAGNESTDACTKSPASAEKAITVGATTIDDTLAYFSNYGKCVDILAPGRYILSAWIGSNQATKNISGTSMASPHVAGIVADYISLDQVKFTPETLSSKLTTLSNKNAIANLPKDTPNLLARNIAPPTWN